MTTGCLSLESGRESSVVESRWTPEAGGDAEKKRKANAAAKDRATAVVMAREMKTNVEAGVFLGEW